MTTGVAGGAEKAGELPDDLDALEADAKRIANEIDEPVCPRCDSARLLAPSAFGRDRRTRCCECGHVWGRRS